ncbi:hypothetical protein HOE425_330974 [Hoeflea sp. EC-HK425]|nr:hypothetical protein HOE425_330974 [Hoeflea sp. EC-HK425]
MFHQIYQIGSATQEPPGIDVAEMLWCFKALIIKGFHRSSPDTVLMASTMLL